MKIFVVVSDQRSSGKTTVAAYITTLLDRNQIKINYLKLNQALSTRIGLLNPLTVGEAFITTDGGQVDKDVGVIERSISYPLFSNSCLTLGQAIDQVNITEASAKDCGYEFLSLDKHLVTYIRNYINSFNKEYITLIEIGGSVQDLGNQAFIETVKSLNSYDNSTMIFIGKDLTLFSSIFSCKPDLHIPQDQISLLRNHHATFSVQSSITAMMQSYLNIQLAPFDLEKTYLHSPYQQKEKVLRIAIVGRYVEKPSGYLSIIESIYSAGFFEGYSIELQPVQSKFITEENISINFQEVHGVCLPGGFGDIGVEGIITVIKHCRIKQIPVFGICFGFQLMVVEFARNVCGMNKAHSIESDPSTQYPVVHKIQHILGFDSEPKNSKYGFMRLGDKKINVVDDCYQGVFFDKERHWHSYALNMVYWPEFKSQGLHDVIWDEASQIVIGITLRNHPFYFATQFHPEFRSHYTKPHEIFRRFIQAAAKYGRKESSC